MGAVLRAGGEAAGHGSPPRLVTPPSVSHGCSWPGTAPLEPLSPDSGPRSTAASRRPSKRGGFWEPWLVRGRRAAPTAEPRASGPGGWGAGREERSRRGPGSPARWRVWGRAPGRERPARGTVSGARPAGRRPRGRAAPPARRGWSSPAGKRPDGAASRAPAQPLLPGRRAPARSVPAQGSGGAARRGRWTAGAGSARGPKGLRAEGPGRSELRGEGGTPLCYDFICAHLGHAKLIKSISQSSVIN